MPAYVIVEVSVTDKDRFAQYTPLVPATLAAYGGRFLARGGKAENLEGGPAALKWYSRNRSATIEPTDSKERIP